MASKPFLTDIQAIRKRAREHIDQGAITAGYSADRCSDGGSRWSSYNRATDSASRGSRSGTLS